MIEIELESRIKFLKDELFYLRHEKSLLKEREYRKTQKYKEKKKRYRERYREKCKAIRRRYRQRPEVKAKRAAENKRYRARPENKMKIREYNKRRYAALSKPRRLRLRDYGRLWAALNGEHCAKVSIRTSLKRHNGITNPPEELVNAILKLNQVKKYLNETNPNRQIDRNRIRITEDRYRA